MGLGNMGTPMAERLLAAGYTVVGYDVDQAARDRLTAAGGTLAAKLASVAEAADVVILMLPNSALVTQVLISDGLAGALHPGATVVDMSSSDPIKTGELAAELQSRGLHMVDAPVSGGVKGARDGTLTIMVGGPMNVFDHVLPLLKALGNPQHIGSKVGAGHALKALNNLMSATHLWVTSEAMMIGKAFGLDPEVMLAAVNGSSGRSGSTENKWPNFILPETYNSGFGLRLMLKDMKIATQLAADLGISSVLSDAAVENWERAAEDLSPGADHTEIAQWLSNQGIETGRS